MVVEAHPIPHDVVAGDTKPAECFLDHLRAVDDELHRLTHADIIERSLIAAHVDRKRLSRGPLDDRVRASVQIGSGLGERDPATNVDLATEKCVDARGVIVDRNDLQLVGIRLGWSQ